MHNEIVLDADCGTGRVAKIIIADTAKKGKVYAGDTDANMIANDKKPQGFSNIAFIKSYLSDIDLPEKVDLVFSNAVIHRILDHKKPFTKNF